MLNIKAATGSFRANDRGHLTVGDWDAVDLARQFGTPLYVLDESAVRDRCRTYKQAMSLACPNHRIIYAGKALLTAAMCRIMQQEGLDLDVVSGGELYTALHADFPPERIFFHGNNKSRDEIDMAVQARVHRIVVDNLSELDLVMEAGRRHGRAVSVMFRITPGVDADTHAHILTGQQDSKFGLSMIGDAQKATALAMGSSHVRLTGYHMHIGSQIMDDAPYREAVRVMFDFMAQMRVEYDFTAAELNVGGGLGVRYTEQDRAMDPGQFVQRLCHWIKTAAAARQYPLPTVMVEPGRSLVASAGLTLYTVGSIKTVPGHRTYVAVDGGMGDNPRVALYDAEYEAIVANRATEPFTQVVSVAGKCCESGDMLLWDFHAPTIESGDVLAVLGTGAYNYSMASHYNRLPKPAMVLVSGEHADVIVARETYADLVRFDRIPARLGDPIPKAGGTTAASHDTPSDGEV